MPNYPEPSAQWLAARIAQVSTDVAAVKAQRTEYVVDNEGACQAIIGNLAHEPSGSATGLKGFGVAVKLADGTWLQVGSGPLYGSATGEVELKTGVTQTAVELPVPAGVYDASAKTQFYGSGTAAALYVEGGGLAAHEIAYWEQSFGNFFLTGRTRVTFPAAGTAKLLVAGTTGSKWAKAEFWLQSV